ncbi:MAG: hypothetical protein STSR0008_24700 [Ignavibacterium sp.]
MNKHIVMILFFLLSFIDTSYSQILEGYVLDDNNNPLIGVNIYLANSNIGTTSNLDGNFLIKLKIGHNKIIFSYIGYFSDTLYIALNKDEVASKKIILRQSHITLQDVIVYADEFNEAEKIIKKVIDNKNDYLSKLTNYSYDAYTKTVLLVPSDDSLRYGGITQTLSKGFYQYPDKFQEVILSKNQTKNITEAHNIFSIGKIPNVLEENLTFDDEKIISPLNSNAIKYYRYEMSDTTLFDYKKVFNIKFYPRNENLHLFSGIIGILDESFVPIKVELYGNNRIITKIRKDIIIKQQFRNYENFFWLPNEIIYCSAIDMGIPGVPSIYLNQLALVTNYEINDTTFAYDFDKYVLKQSTIISDNQSDSLWQVKQIMTLTNEETKEFLRIDSVVTNADLFTKLAIGLTQSLTSINSLPFTNMNDFYHFNRVEGNYLGFGFDSKNIFDELKIKFKLGYGFSNKKEKYYFSLNYLLNNSFSPFIEIYNKTEFIDRFYDYNIFDLTYQSLFFKNDYADYFYTKGFNVGFEIKLNSYLKTKISFFNEKQENASVNTAFSLFNKNEKFRLPFMIQDGEVRAIYFSFLYDDRKYYDYGVIKSPDNSDNYTRINLDYIYSSRIFNSDYSFHQIHFDINRLQRIHSLLNININVRGGLLLNDKISQYKFHLPGNYGTLAASNSFRTILSDEFIGDRYFAFFIENNFKNTLFNFLRIPFLEHNKYDLLLYFNWSTTNNKVLEKQNNQHYYEIGVGLGNILSFFRLDFTWQLSKQNTKNFVLSLTSSL